VRLIIDCGAYVGYSSRYFLHRYPNARLIAVEPDPGNFAMLQKNLAPYGDRVRLVRSGIWSHSAPMKISEAPYRDGREWARQVRVCQPGEAPDFMAVDLGTLLADSGMPSISILKLDIERAEAELFTHDYEEWIDRVDNLVVELHDEECRAAFYRATANRQLEVSETHFLGVCKHRNAAVPQTSEPERARVPQAVV
jgi:FkbM family methyltransferase